MNIHVVKSKLHNVTVTEANLNYVGSITIDEELMEEANIIENEKVQVVNNNKKHSVDISFKINDHYRNTDRYTIMITLYPNYRSEIRVQSTSRTSILYMGRVSNMESDEK